jgi:hypothetical protein
VRFPPRLLKQSLQWFSRWVAHPTQPCRPPSCPQIQILVATGRLDLLWLETQPCCGRLYLLRDSNPLPPAPWSHVRVAPHLCDRLRPGRVGDGWCLTRQLLVTRVPVGSDLRICQRQKVGIPRTHLEPRRNLVVDWNAIDGT